MKEISVVVTGEARLRVRGRVEVQGIDPTDVRYVVRELWDPEAVVWELLDVEQNTTERFWTLPDLAKALGNRQ